MKQLFSQLKPGKEFKNFPGTDWIIFVKVETVLIGEENANAVATNGVIKGELIRAYFSDQQMVWLEDAEVSGSKVASPAEGG